MTERGDFLDRAKMTVERTAMQLRDLREALDSSDGLDAGSQHFLWDSIIDLEWRHSLLSDMYLDLLLSPPIQRDARWQKFAICHDDYRDAAKEFRSELALARQGASGVHGRTWPGRPGTSAPTRSDQSPRRT